MLLFWEVSLMPVSYARKTRSSYLWQTELMITQKESSVWGFFLFLKGSKIEQFKDLSYIFLSSAGEEIT